jgi:hypothetical protein
MNSYDGLCLETEPGEKATEVLGKVLVSRDAESAKGSFAFHDLIVCLSPTMHKAATDQLSTIVDATG